MSLSSSLLELIQSSFVSEIYCDDSRYERQSDESQFSMNNNWNHNEVKGNEFHVKKKSILVRRIFVHV